MENIKYTPIKETTLNDKLVNLYGPLLPGLYMAVKPLFDVPDAIKPALPLLIELNDDESYEKADLRIMVFGRETNNWNDMKYRGQYPFGTYNFNLRTSDDVVTEIMGKHVDGEEELYGLGDLYHGYFYPDDNTGGKREITTPFTRRSDQLIDMLRARMPDRKIEYLWNNVSKIGCGGKTFGGCCCRPTPEIREIERKYFNVVAEEVKILKPDIILFLTGFGADQEIKEKFGISDEAFHPVAEGIFLDRIDIPCVKYAARTIHPSQPGQGKEYFHTHFKAIVDDIARIMG